MKTNIVVRVQAKGGKFLADDIGGALVTIHNKLTGECLATGVTRGNSGLIKNAYEPDASQRVIVTPKATPVINWLVPDSDTSNFTATLDLDEPTLLEFSAYGPLGGLQSAHTVKVSQSVIPGKSLNVAAGFVIELPGVIVQPLAPPTHTKLTLSTVNQALEIPLEVKVAMMCGCPIEPDALWLPDDFEVNAAVKEVGSSNPASVISLTFNGKVAGIFTGSYSANKPGNYEISFSAFQKSTGNAGSAVVTFLV